MFEMFSSIPSIMECWQPVDNTWGYCPPKGPLYHYTGTASAIQNIISQKELWLSKYTVQNDNKEIYYGLDLLKGIFCKALRDNKRFSELTEDIKQDNIYSLFGDVFTCSFSKNGNATELWNRYATNGFNIEFSPKLVEDLAKSTPNIHNVCKDEKGFVQEFHGFRVSVKTEKMEFLVPAVSWDVMSNEVIYDRTKQERIVHDITQYIIEQDKQTERTNVTFAIIALLDFIPFFKDGTVWDKEEEYRICIRIKNGNPFNIPSDKRNYLQQVQHFRVSDDILKPYIILSFTDCSYINAIHLPATTSNTAVDVMRDFAQMYSNRIEVHKCT